MKTLLKQIIVCFVCAVLLLAVGFWRGKKYGEANGQKVVIKTETVTKTEWVKVAQTPEELTAAYLSPIEISGQMVQPDMLRVIASDGYKTAEKDFGLQIKGDGDGFGWTLGLSLLGAGALVGTIFILAKN